MKSMRQFILPLFSGLLFLSGTSASAADSAKNFDQTKPLRIAQVSFKLCVEKSKMGQKEQGNFDGMKKQMESVLEGKEKSLTDVAGKFNDIDYLDSLSPDAEAELKRQFRTLNQEFTQQQQQFYQTLSQANMMIIQKLTDAVTKASTVVAKTNSIDLVLNEESSFFAVSSIDISDLVVKAMDEAFEKEPKDAKVGN
ncbi:MAG: OmpH family outer membrane protein [Parachlamydiaceae bacterium]